MTMNYRKKLTIRMCFAIGYTIIGAALIFIGLLGSYDNEMLSMFGAAFCVCGIMRIVQNLRIRKNEDSIRQREIAEKDERNIMIWERARSMAFGIYVILAGAAIILLYCLKMNLAAQIIAYMICALVFIYWICYHIVRKKY